MRILKIDFWEIIIFKYREVYFREGRERVNFLRNLRVGISFVLKYGRDVINIFRSRISVRDKEGEVREEGKEKNSRVLRKNVDYIVKIVNRLKRRRSEKRLLDLVVIKMVIIDIRGSSFS